jgi:hypothetical protein
MLNLHKYIKWDGRRNLSSYLWHIDILFLFHRYLPRLALISDNRIKCIWIYWVYIDFDYKCKGMYNINNFVVLLSWARMGLTPIDKSPPTHSMIMSFNMLSIMSGIHSETMNIYWSTYKESSLVKYIWHNSILDKMENNEFQIILWIKNVIKGIMLNDKYSTPPHKVYWIKIASAIFCCFSNLIRESER